MISGQHIVKIFANDHQYEPYLIRVNRQGWFYEDSKNEKNYEVNKSDFSITLASGEHIRFDLAMLLIGGAPGEDGQIQGYLELMNIPYVGCGILASAVTFNKSFANRLVRSFDSENIHVSPSIEVTRTRSDHLPDMNSLRFPLIVKPVDSGSSLGVTKVNDPSELPTALQTAFRESKQALIEQFIIGREITVGVVRLNNKIQVLPITEIVHPSQGGFFDITAKFVGETGIKLVTPAELDDDTVQRVQNGVTEVYERLGLQGLVRIDLMLEEPNHKVYFLEVNAAPSQTEYSILMRQITCAGWGGDRLVEFYKQIIQSIVKIE